MSTIFNNTNYTNASAIHPASTLFGAAATVYESDELFGILDQLLVYSNGAGDNTGGLNFSNPNDPNSAWQIQQLASTLNTLDTYYTNHAPTGQYDMALLNDFNATYGGTTLKALLSDPVKNLSAIQNFLSDNNSPLYKLLHTDLMAQIKNSSYNYNPNDGSVHSVPISTDPTKPTNFNNVFSDFQSAMNAANTLFNLATSNKETDPTKGFLNAYLITTANAFQGLEQYFAQFPSSDNLGYIQVMNNAFNSPLETSKGVIGSTSFESLLSSVTSGSATAAQMNAFMNALLPSGQAGKITVPFGNDMGSILFNLVNTIQNVRHFTQPHTQN